MSATVVADTFRYRYGETDPVSMPFLQNSTELVAIGDFVYVDSANQQSSQNTVRQAGNFTWQSAVATPSAPTVANTTTTFATGLTNSATGVKVSYQFPWGEGALSNAGSATPTANAGILMTGFAVPVPVVAVNVYVESSAGSGTYKLYGSYPVLPQSPQLGGQGVGNVLIAGYGVGTAPFAGNASGAAVTSAALDVTQYFFGKQFLGVAAQRWNGTVNYVGSAVTAFGMKDGLLRANTSGVYDFACASASFNAGDLIGVAKDTGNNLANQKVVAVAHASLAIARVVRAAATVTTVRGKLIGGVGR